MKLSICIPTHHGRKPLLEELLESILHEISCHGLWTDVQICISDNASSDGTKDMVEKFGQAYPNLIKYNRLDTNTGIRNFFTVIEMADAEYCWLVGSDDAIIPSGIKHILECVTCFPNLPGITINKLNFDRSLANLIGPDHDQVLPRDSHNSRCMQGSQEILKDLFMTFCFISAHIFKKKLWDRVIAKHGIDFILGFRHFPHTFIYLEIATQHGSWYWLSDYCVIQRLENFTFTQDVSDRELDYAEQLSTDLVQVAAVAFPEKGDAYLSIMTRLFFVYWNPWFVLKYAGNSSTTSTEISGAKHKCMTWFGHSAFFWMTTYPVFCLPSGIARLILSTALKRQTRAGDTSVQNSARAICNRTFHLLLRLLRIENKHPTQTSSPESAADSFLQIRKNRGTNEFTNGATTCPPLDWLAHEERNKVDNDSSATLVISTNITGRS